MQFLKKKNSEASSTCETSAKKLKKLTFQIINKE